MADIQNLKDFTPKALHYGNFWLSWMYKDGRKIPVTATGQAISHLAPLAHTNIDEVIAQHKADPNLGVGITLGNDGLQIGAYYVWSFDLDGFAARLADGTVALDDGTYKFLQKPSTWAEVSPSETGLKIFFLSEKAPIGKKIAKFPPSKFRDQFPEVRKYQHREVEVFTKGFFLAITGERLGDWVDMKKLTEAETDTLLEELNAWAVSEGGEGFGKRQKANELPQGSAQKDSAWTQGRKEFAKPLLEDMTRVLLYVDAEDEQVYTDTANGLARTYGEAGRGAFLTYCSRSTVTKHQESLAAGGVDERYTRALREAVDRPEGYTAKHIIEVAQQHPDWPCGFQIRYEGNVESDPNGLFSASGLVREQLELPLGGEAPNFRFVFKTASEVRNTPPMKWRIKELLPERGFGLIFGESGSGKSFMVFDMGACLALGQSFYGRKVNPCPVVYVALEGGAGISKRVQAWEKYHDQKMPDSFRIVTDALSLLNSDALAFASGLSASGLSGGVIIIDTLNQSAPGADENSPADMGRIISNAMVIQRLTDSLVLLVHHTGKDKSKGPRGHSSLHGALDIAIEVKKAASGREWGIYKLKDAESGIYYSFKLDAVDLGVDEDGDIITSCVAIGDPFRASKPNPPKGKNQAAVLAAIKACADDSLALPYADALKAGFDALMDVEPKHRKERAAGAIDTLVKGGNLILDGGTLEIIL